VVLIIWQITSAAAPTIAKHGLEPLASTEWDGKTQFGLLPQIWGTLYSSLLGVLLGALFGVAVPEPDRDCLGRLARAGRARPRQQHPGAGLEQPTAPLKSG